jgi:adenosine deaminase
MLPEKMVEYLTRLPKINLHVHIEGSIQLPTLLDIAKKNNYLSELTPEQIELLNRKEYTYTDFPSFIDMYSLCANALRTADDYERSMYEYLIGAHRQNVRYVEAYVSPYGRMKKGVEFDEIMSGITAGQKHAELETGIMSSIVIDVGRHLLWTTKKDGENRKDPDHARLECIRLVELVNKYNNANGGIAGFSLGGKEVGFPVYPFVDAFRLARENNLHVKAHTSESNNSDDVWYVIGLLKVERVSNSVQVAEDKELMDYLRENKIAIELSPTGDVLTSVVASLDRHPFRKFFDHGIAVAIGDNDPALFGVDLQQEYQIIVDQFGFSTIELEFMTNSMLDIAWLDQTHKQILREKMQNEIRDIHKELGL